MPTYVLKDGNTGTSGLAVTALGVYQKFTIQQGKYTSTCKMSHIYIYISECVVRLKSQSTPREDCFVCRMNNNLFLCHEFIYSKTWFSCIAVQSSVE